jgi:hypothetical protein
MIADDGPLKTNCLKRTGAKWSVPAGAYDLLSSYSSKAFEKIEFLLCTLSVPDALIRTTRLVPLKLLGEYLLRCRFQRRF